MALPTEEVLSLAEQLGSGGGRGPTITEGSAAAPVVVPDAPSNDGYTKVDPQANPQLARDLANQAMGKDAPITPPSGPPVAEIELPGGYIDSTGKLYDKVRIRELDGADEEELAKPYNRTIVSFIDTVIKRCTLSFGDLKAEPGMMNDLLIGDRETIYLHARILTFGKDIDMPVICPNCEHAFDIRVDLETDVPRKELPGDPKERTRECILPRGEIAHVNLMTGGAQMATYGPEDINDAERTTLMLKECVYSIDDNPITTTDQVRKLSLSARRALNKFLRDNSCGPQFAEVMQTCPNCQDSFPVPLNLVAMFL